MATFEVKYRAGSETKNEILTASDEAAAGKAFGSTHQGISAADVISVIELAEKPKWSDLSGTQKALRGGGIVWVALIVLVSVGGVLAAIAGNSGVSYSLFGILPTIVGVGAVVLGIFAALTGNVKWKRRGKANRH